MSTKTSRQHPLLQQQQALLQRLFGDQWEAAAERLRHLEARRQGARPRE